MEFLTGFIVGAAIVEVLAGIVVWEMRRSFEASVKSHYDFFERKVMELRSKEKPND